MNESKETGPEAEVQVGSPTRDGFADSFGAEFEQLATIQL
jgi:hypothetical protein